MRIRERLTSLIEPHPAIKDEAVRLWNAKFDMLGRMITDGDYVAWAGTTQTVAGESIRIYKVVGANTTTTKIRVCETEDTSKFSAIYPDRCIVITEQMRINIQNPLQIPAPAEG